MLVGEPNPIPLHYSAAWMGIPTLLLFALASTGVALIGLGVVHASRKKNASKAIVRRALTIIEKEKEREAAMAEEKKRKKKAKTEVQKF